MDAKILIILVGLTGGMAVGLQGPLASSISSRLGTLESVFIIHMGGAMAALIPLIIAGGGNLKNWQTVPWYALVAGTLGLVVIAAISFMIPRIGVAPAFIVLVAGQILTGVVLDHFGWLGATVRPVDLTRVLGLLLVAGGVWLTMR